MATDPTPTDWHDGPYVDNYCDFFAFIGVHRKLWLIRQMVEFCGCSVRELGEDRKLWENIRQVKVSVADISDENTWNDEVQEQVRDSEGSWPYEWDALMLLDADGPLTATVYRDHWEATDE